MARHALKTHDEQRKLMDLLSKGYDYLNNNFGKFDQKTKVQIALELIKRRVPQEFNTSSEVKVKVTHETIEERLPCLSSEN